MNATIKTKAIIAPLAGNKMSELKITNNHFKNSFPIPSFDEYSAYLFFAEIFSLEYDGTKIQNKNSFKNQITEKKAARNSIFSIMHYQPLSSSHP
ncbi:hypothetical protein [Methylomonas methanica]|uniref:hypothetical protein n=1 Tax=Methylomonas methanica TaxID=421 RepID=UPI001A9F8D63|nr:hypothetical protein [Methylomonas methanica]